MKRILLAAAALAALPFAAGAQEINSQPGPYVQAGAGLAWALGTQNNVTTYTGWAIGGGVGGIAAARMKTVAKTTTQRKR